MKLISVQSRGDRLAIVERFEIFGRDYVLTRKAIRLCHVAFHRHGRMIAFGTEISALKAAEQWLKGARDE